MDSVGVPPVFKRQAHDKSLLQKLVKAVQYESA